MPDAWNLTMWTETLHPADYPTKHVVRRSEIGPSGAQMTDEVLTFDSREELVAEMFHLRGLSFLLRNEGDDPVIVGTWL